MVIEADFAKVFAVYENIEIACGPGKLMPDFNMKYEMKVTDFKGIISGI